MNNAIELIYIEALLKGSAGLMLVLFPGVTIKVLGLAPSTNNFWPRALGAVLLGLACAGVLEVTLRAQGGLGLAGSIAINLSSIAIIGSHLILGKAAPTRRGRLVLWLTLLALSLLSLLELAFAL